MFWNKSDSIKIKNKIVVKIMRGDFYLLLNVTQKMSVISLLLAI